MRKKCALYMGKYGTYPVCKFDLDFFLIKANVVLESN